MISYNFAKRSQIVTEKVADYVAVYHLADVKLQDIAEINRYYSQQNLKFFVISEIEFQKKISQIFEANTRNFDATTIDFIDDSLPSTSDLLENNDEAPIIKLLNSLFTKAIKAQASDIHIETYEEQILIRNRIDGVLQVVTALPRKIAPLLISRIKVMAKLDIAEKRLPQDGRISLTIGAQHIDIRVSTLPATHGERVVLRVLDKQAVRLDLEYLDLNATLLHSLKSLIKQPHGIILVTGPTGSGKTTTLYAILNELNEKSRNILTIEDPIEYDLPGIGQTQVNEKIAMSFAKGLRAILRQDPDVVMIGEIRDSDTANIAIQASLTGHLVFSTLHTNSALSAINRLIDMNVASFLLASSIVGLVAQRLVRKLCVHCKQPFKTNDFVKLLNKTIYKAQGCAKCCFTGYMGRMAIYEIITVGEQLKGMIHRTENIADLQKHARKFSASIEDNGFDAVINGNTSVEEVLRVFV